VEFPSIYSGFVDVLSAVSLDFLSLDCIEGTDYFSSVYAWCFVPIALAVLNFAVFAARVSTSSSSTRQGLESSHTYAFLILSYMVLPPVSRKLFQSLDCISVAGGSYLRIDTGIDCEDGAYQRFLVPASFLLVIYLSIPVVWFVLLYRKRDLLNPGTGDDPEFKRYLRSMSTEMDSFRFLFEVYSMPLWWFECVELYRRVAFVGVLPLVSTKTSRRSAFGVFVALASIAVYRETEPFEAQHNNILIFVAQYAILLTYGSALAISTDLSKGLDDVAFGLILITVNLVVLGMALLMLYMRYTAERSVQEKARERRAMQVESAVGFSLEKMETTLR